MGSYIKISYSFQSFVMHTGHAGNFENEIFNVKMDQMPYKEC